MSPPLRKPADARKAEIVATTLRLADELGPDRLTTKAVADAVGLTQPAIFRHFPTKQRLWQAVAESIAERMTTAWHAVLATDHSPPEKIAALMSVQLHQIEANPAIPAILVSRELHSENEPLRGMFLALMSEFHGHLAGELGRARQSGVFRADLDPQDGAVLLTALIQGLAIRWTLGARGFALKPEGLRLLAVQIGLFYAAPRSEMTP